MKLVRSIGPFATTDFLRGLPGREMFQPEELRLYDGFLGTYGQVAEGRILPITIDYVRNARALHASFRGVPRFDWSLTIIELGKAFEEEFRPRFVRMARDERAAIEGFHTNRKPGRKLRLEDMSFGAWIGVLRHANQYPKLHLAATTRESLAQVLPGVKDLRDKAAHAEGTLPTQTEASDMARQVLALPTGLLPQALTIPA